MMVHVRPRWPRLWLLVLFVAMGSSSSVAASVIFTDGFEAEDIDGLDERRVRSVIAGLPPGGAHVDWLIEAVGNNGGFPVATKQGTFLFVARCDAETWLLAGDFNGWNPEPMSRHGAMCWSERAVVPALEQRYRLEGAGSSQFADPAARRYLHVDGEEISLVRSAQQRIERGFGFGPQVGLPPRMVRVLVPEAEVFDRTLYMHDGQDLFDPQAAFGGWDLQTRVPPGVLVVGIDATAGRLAEYTHVTDDLGGIVGGDGDVYADLVHHHVRPWIERRHGAGERNGVLGSSLGGLISLHIAHRYPTEWDFAGSMSGSLGWGRIGNLFNDTMMMQYAASGRRAIAVYLDSGGGAGEPCIDSDGDGVRDDGANSDNYCVTLQMRDTLLGIGYLIGDDLVHVHAPDEGSNAAAWRERLATPLQQFSDL